MASKEQIIEVIKLIGSIFQDNDFTWIIAASCGLLVHGLDITPNDIDVVIHPSQYLTACNLLQDYFITEEVFRNDLKKSKFIIKEIECELMPIKISKENLEIKFIDGVPIYVNSLKAEYEMYKSRVDKLEANKAKINLIEKAMGLG
jgi:hypothetical protein